MIRTRFTKGQGVDQDFLSEQEFNDFFAEVVITGTTGRDDTELVNTFEEYFPGQGLITAGSGIVVTTGTNFVRITSIGGGGATDHGLLTGLTDDDHTHYSLVDGTRAFTGVVGGITPTSSDHLATKGYTDGEVAAVSGTLSAEIDSDISTHASISSAHHVRYADSEAIAALEPTTSELAASGVQNASDISDNTALILATSGSLSSEIDADIATHTEISSAHHTRYSKNENDALVGSDGITVVSGANSIDIQGFRTEFVNASGTLSDEIDSDISTHAAISDSHHSRYTDAESIAALEPTTSALAASGVQNASDIVDNTTLITTTSGHLQSEIDSIDASVTLQEAYDNGDGVITTTAGKSVTISGADANAPGLTVVGSGIFTEDLTVDTDTFHVNAATNSVGIGILAPAARLHVRTASSDSRLRISAGNPAGGVLELEAEASQRYSIKADRSANLLTINSTFTDNMMTFHPVNGRIGINIAAAEERLHVVGSGIIEGDLSVTGDITGNIPELLTASGHLQSEIDAVEGSDVDSVNGVLGDVLITGSVNFPIRTEGQTITVSGADFIDNLTNAYDGIIDATDNTYAVTSNGTTITFTLDRTGGSSAAVQLHGGNFTTSFPDSVTLTPAGSDTNPQENWIYIVESAGVLTLTANTSGFPEEETAHVARVIVQTAATVQTDGPLKLHAYTDHIHEPDARGGIGHINAINERIRAQFAEWDSGTVLTTTTTTGPTPDDITIQVAAGVIYQLHTHTVPAMDTSASDVLHVFNDFTSPYTTIQSLSEITDYNDGSTIGVTDRFNVVIWGAVAENDADTRLFINLPGDGYNNDSNASNDVLNTALYTIPRDYAGVGWLLARLTVKRSAGGNTWTIINNLDIRGVSPSTFPGGVVIGGAGITDHGLLTGLLDDDHTQYSLADGTRAFSGVVGGVTPAASSDLSTKGYVDGEVAAVSGTLSSEIDSDISTHTSNASAHHVKYTDSDAISALEPTTSALSASGVAHEADSTIHFTEGSIDHGSIAGLSDDDHTQYSLVDGTRDFTGPINIDGAVGIKTSSPTESLHVIGSGIMDALGLGVSPSASLGLDVRANEMRLWNAADATTRLNVAAGDSTDTHNAEIILLDRTSPKWSIGKAGTSQTLFFRDRMLERNIVEIRIDENTANLLTLGGDRVGIGTISPTERLHVVGSGIVTGDLTVGGDITGDIPELLTVSGHLQSEIDAVESSDVDSVNSITGAVLIAGDDGNTISNAGQTVTVNGFHDEFVNASGTLSSEIDSDISTHAAISTAHHAKYTDSEALVATESARFTMSGTLSAEIDSDISTHAAISTAHHVKYTDGEAIAALEPTTSALAASGIAHEADSSIHFAEGSIDHGAIAGLSDDDHSQYSLATGLRAFSGVVAGVTPVSDADLSTKGYVDGEIDSDISTHAAISTAHHTKYTDSEAISALEPTTSALSASGVAHEADSSIHFTEGSIDHVSIAGLSGDDHTQYSLADGTRAFSGDVTIDNNADSAIALNLDSGSSTTQNAVIGFRDQGTIKWTIIKDASNDFELIDEAQSHSPLVIKSHADNTDLLYLDNGWVGIGAAAHSPQKLDVVGNEMRLWGRSEATTRFNIGAGSSTDNHNVELIFLSQTAPKWIIGKAGGSHNFFWRDKVLERNVMTIRSGENTDDLLVLGSDRVGIGTASPTERLHVVGSGIFTGDLDVQGVIDAPVTFAPPTGSTTVPVITIRSEDSTPSNDDILGKLEFFSDADSFSSSNILGSIRARTGFIISGHPTGQLEFYTSSNALGETLAMTIGSSGDVTLAGDLIVSGSIESATPTQIALGYTGNGSTQIVTMSGINRVDKFEIIRYTSGGTHPTILGIPGGDTGANAARLSDGSGRQISVSAPSAGVDQTISINSNDATWNESGIAYKLHATGTPS